MGDGLSVDDVRARARHLAFVEWRPEMGRPGRPIARVGAATDQADVAVCRRSALFAQCPVVDVLLRLY